MEVEIKNLTDKYNEAMTHAESYRKKYDGKLDSMTPEEEQSWTKAIEDADRYRDMIKAAKKEAELKDWSNQRSDRIDFMIPGTKKTVTQEESAELKMFDDFMRKGPRDFLKTYSADDLKAFSVQSDVEGGYLTVPEAVSGRFIESIKDDVFLRRYGTVIPLDGAQSLGTPTLETDAEDFDWTAELLTGGEEDTMRFGKRSLTPTPVAKRVKISRTLVRLSPKAVEVIMARLRYKHAVTEEKAFLTGTGNNQPLGLLTASAQGVSTGRDMATATANVAAGDDFWNTYGSLKAGYRSRSRWLIHRNMETRIRKMKDANNNYIWQPGGGFNGQFMVTGMPETICGRPYDISEYMPDTGYTGNITTGTYAAVLGDFSFYWIVDSLQMEMQVLDQLYAEQNQIGYILRKESDGMPVLEEAFARMKVA